MKVEKISDTSIEFIIEKTELKEKNINVKKLVSEESYAQGVVLDLIEEAELNYGININNNGKFKIYIQTNEDTFNITISSFDPHCKRHDMYSQLLQQFTEMGINEEYLKEYSADSLEDKIKAKINSNLPALRTPQKIAKCLIYCFDDMINIKLALNALDVNFQNEILYKYKQKYYLVLFSTKHASNKKKIEEVFGEYATLVTQNGFDLILQEYGDKIIKCNARKIINLYY